MSLDNVHLTPQLVQAVRDAGDIVEIASEYTRLRKAGRRFSGLCPLHKEKTPSFSVDPDQGLFYCFGCGTGGDTIKLHMLLSGDDFPGAIEALARRYGIPLPKAPASRGGGRRETERNLEGVLEAAAAFFSDRLRRSAGPLEYLRRRRVPAEIVERYGLGYAPEGWKNLLEALHPRIPLADLQAAGLVARSEKSGEPYDRFRHRLIFPIREPSGRLVGFGGRALGDDKAKYLNTAETSRFHKSRLLYGLDQAKRTIRESGRVLLVEGYFDVLGAVVAGLEGTVASMGTALTPEQVRLLGRYAGEVVVGYDGDEAGEQAYRRGLPLLLAAGLSVTRPEFGAGEDPDSLRLKAGDSTLLEAVSQAADAPTREIERLTPPAARQEPRLQAQAASRLVELLKPIEDSVLRYGYMRRAADRLGVPPEYLLRRLSGRRPAEEDAPTAITGGPLEWSLEQRVLQLLLAGGGEVPPPTELPPPEVFLQAANRNIYAAFCALYSGGDGSLPDAKGVLGRCGEDNDAVDRVARLLLEGPSASGPGELVEGLRQLRRRWQQQRLKELSRDIGEAQVAGDAKSLERLLTEKTALSRALHRRSD